MTSSGPDKVVLEIDEIRIQPFLKPGVNGTFSEGKYMIWSRKSGLFFDPFVNAMGRRPYCPSRMEVSYCTFGFGAIIRRDLLTLPRDSPRDNLYACVI